MLTGVNRNDSIYCITAPTQSACPSSIASACALCTATEGCTLAAIQNDIAAFDIVEFLEQCYLYHKLTVYGT